MMCWKKWMRGEVAGVMGLVSAVSTIAGKTTAGFADGTGSAASFRAPRGIGLDAAGALWVVDTDNNRIRKLTFQSNAWTVRTVAGSSSTVGSFSDGTGSNAGFKGPRGGSFDAFGNFWVLDNDNNRIRRVSPVGGTS